MAQTTASEYWIRIGTGSLTAFPSFLGLCDLSRTLQVYNDNLYDLLDGSRQASATVDFNVVYGGLLVRGLPYIPCWTPDTQLKLVCQAAPVSYRACAPVRSTWCHRA